MATNTPLLLAAIVAAPFLLPAAVPLRWTAEASRPAPYQAQHSAGVSANNA